MDYKWLIISVFIFLFIVLLFIFTPYKYVPSGKGAIYKINRFTQEIHIIYEATERKVNGK